MQQRCGAPTTPTANSTILAYSDVGHQRVQRNIQMDQIQERYLNQSNQSRVKMVKSPWEAALETGSANNAFVAFNQGENQQQGPMSGQIYSATVGANQQFEYGPPQPAASTYQSGSQQQSYQSGSQSVKSTTSTKRDVQVSRERREIVQINFKNIFPAFFQFSKFSGNVLAYKPTVPQGWKRNIDLPSGKRLQNFLLNLILI